VLAPANFGTVTQAIFDWVVTNLGWFYLLAGNFPLLFVVCATRMPPFPQRLPRAERTEVEQRKQAYALPFLARFHLHTKHERLASCGRMRHLLPQTLPKTASPMLYWEHERGGSHGLEHRSPTIVSCALSGTQSPRTAS
jgi:hypothetical protein